MTRNHRVMIPRKWQGLRQSHLAKKNSRRKSNKPFERSVGSPFHWIGVDRYPFQCLLQWFSNHASANNGTRRDSLAWLPLLRRLHQLRHPRPRKRSAVQQYMLDYPDRVNAAFIHKYADGRKLSSAEKMNLRYEVAKVQLAQKYSHLIAELEKKATEQHNAEVDEWSLILDGVSFAEDVPRYVFSLVDFLSFIDSTAFIEPTIPFSTPFIHSSGRSAPMLIATFP